MSKGKSWPELGVITKNEAKDKEGNLILDANGNKTYRLGFKLHKDVTVLVKGEPVALNKGKTGFLTKPKDEVEQLYKNGVIPDDEIEARRQKVEDNAWLHYKITLPPPRD